MACLALTPTRYARPKSLGEGDAPAEATMLDDETGEPTPNPHPHPYPYPYRYLYPYHYPHPDPDPLPPPLPQPLRLPLVTTRVVTSYSYLLLPIFSGEPLMQRTDDTAKALTKP